MISTKTGFILTILLLTSSSVVLADGMMITAPEYFLDESSQQAVLQYDEENQIETLSILPGFRGDAREFAWILPIPAQPLVEEGDATLFRQLREFTRPKTRYRDDDWDGCDSSRDYAILNDASPGVEIIESRLVGYYQTMTLASDQADVLIDSLSVWGFLHSDNIEEATDLINNYVEKDWYFVTVKVDSTSFAEIFPQNYYGYYTGHLEPLTFTFGSEEIIYPMRISSLSAAESTQVNLFVVANHRMTFPGASARYANRFTQTEINNINSSYFSSVKNLVEPGDFLTHLRKDFRPQDMTEDITIIQANTDDEYWLIRYSGFPWMTSLLLGPAILWGLYRKFTHAFG
jgi:hypothetical protein